MGAKQAKRYQMGNVVPKGPKAANTGSWSYRKPSFS